MITDETKRAHRATWWVYAGTERIRHTAAMRGSWGYDVTCSCGWDSRTGGGLRRYVAGQLEAHRYDAQDDAALEAAAQCGARMAHRDGSVSRCTLPRGHNVQIEDSNHVDEHGCFAPVLVHQSTLREVARVSAEWPDAIHTCAELQRAEPGRRPCTCGRCPQ